jgi:uncharacterized protein YukE
VIPTADGGGYFASIPGDPDEVRAAASQIARLATRIGTHGTSVARQSTGVVGFGWSGPAATRFDGLAHRLAVVHTDIQTVLGTLPSALSAYADELETAQQQIQKATLMMQEAVESFSSSVAALPVVAADAAPSAQQDHQAAASSIKAAYQDQAASATSLARTATAEHQVAVARLAAHVNRVAGEGRGVQETLTQIGDSLGIPVAVLSALSTVAMLRAAERLAPGGSAFGATAAREADQLTRFLARAMLRGEVNAEEAVDRLVAFADNKALAQARFANNAKADAGAGGLLDLGRFTDAAKWSGRGAGLLALAGDAYIIWHPDEAGAWGDVEGGMAAANGAGTAGLPATDGFGLAEAGGLLAADASLGWVPIAGQVLVVGTGLYLLGDYLYSHPQWFHDGIDAVGTGFVDAGEAIGHGTVATMHAISAGVNDVNRAVDTGLSDAGHAVGTALGDAGPAMGSTATSVAHLFGL